MNNTKMKNGDALVCELCGDDIKPDPTNGWTLGHNAWPLLPGEVDDDGDWHSPRCCSRCDTEVLFARLGRSWDASPPPADSDLLEALLTSMSHQGYNGPPVVVSPGK